MPKALCMSGLVVAGLVIILFAADLAVGIRADVEAVIIAQRRAIVLQPGAETAQRIQSDAHEKATRDAVATLTARAWVEETPRPDKPKRGAKLSHSAIGCSRKWRSSIGTAPRPEPHRNRREVPLTRCSVEGGALQEIQRAQVALHFSRKCSDGGAVRCGRSAFFVEAV